MQDCDEMHFSSLPLCFSKYWGRNIFLLYWSTCWKSWEFNIFTSTYEFVPYFERMLYFPFILEILVIIASYNLDAKDTW